MDGHLPGKGANREQEDPEEDEDLKKNQLKNENFFKYLPSFRKSSGRGGKSR